MSKVDALENGQVDGLGFVHFSLELAMEPDRQRTLYFGAAVFGQLRREDVLDVGKDVTRSHVQKAVALLSREPVPFPFALSIPLIVSRLVSS